MQVGFLKDLPINGLGLELAGVVALGLSVVALEKVSRNIQSRLSDK